MFKNLKNKHLFFAVNNEMCIPVILIAPVMYNTRVRFSQKMARLL
jgi:hypothetical protein